MNYIRNCFRAILIAAIGSVIGAPVKAARTPEPHELIQVLMSMQQRAVHGDREAHAKRSMFAVSIGRTMAKAGPEIWRQERNLDALIVFLLSGGFVPAVERTIAEKDIPVNRRKMLLGAFAYARGDRSQAARYLAGLDMEKAPPQIVGPMGLALAAVLPQSRKELALRTLQRVELLVPGTLYEETALRRQVMFLDKKARFSEFVALVERFERRFPQSPYAGTFRQYVLAVVKDRLLAATRFDDSQIDAIKRTIPAAGRFDLLLAVAKEALTVGKADTAAWLASFVCRAKSSNGRTRLVASRLLALSKLTARRFSGAEKCLPLSAEAASSAEASFLSELANGVATRIRAVDPPSAGETRLNRSASAEKQNPAVSKLLSRAGKSLRAASEVLKDKEPNS